MPLLLYARRRRASLELLASTLRVYALLDASLRHARLPQNIRAATNEDRCRSSFSISNLRHTAIPTRIGGLRDTAYQPFLSISNMLISLILGIYYDLFLRIS